MRHTTLNQRRRRGFRAALALVAIAAAIALAGPADAAAWQFETLDGHQNGPNGRLDAAIGGDETAAVTFGGVPHIWYQNMGNGDLRHAWWSGSAWHFETLDGAGGTNGRTTGIVGFNITAALYGGVPHVWYTDETGGNLRHAWWSGSAWFFETLDGAGGANGRVDGVVGANPAVTIYAGAPHVWYLLQSTVSASQTFDLRHGWWTGTKWSFETLDGHQNGPHGQLNSVAGQWSAVALYGGAPHVWYRGGVSNDLRHAWWSGSYWSFETLDGAVATPKGAIVGSMGLDTTVAIYGGVPHVWNVDSATGDLRHGWWNGSAWYFEKLAGDSSGLATDFNALDVTSMLYGGAAHVWHHEFQDRVLQHRWTSGNGWGAEVLDGNGGGAGRITADVGKAPSTLVYGNGAHVWYLDSSGGNLRHAWYG